MAERDTQLAPSILDTVSTLEESVKNLIATVSEQKSIIGELRTKVASCEHRIRQLETKRVLVGEGESTSKSIVAVLDESIDTKRERKRRFENLKTSLSSAENKNHHTETAISPTNGANGEITTTTVSALSSETKRRRGGGLEKNPDDRSSGAMTFARKTTSRSSTACRRTFGTDISNTSSIPRRSSRRSVGNVDPSKYSSLRKSNRLAVVNTNSALKRKRERKRQLEDLSILLRSTTSSEDAFTAITPTNNAADENEPPKIPFGNLPPHKGQDQHTQSHMSTANHGADKESIQFRNETTVLKHTQWEGRATPMP